MDGLLDGHAKNICKHEKCTMDGQMDGQKRVKKHVENGAFLQETEPFYKKMAVKLPLNDIYYS